MISLNELFEVEKTKSKKVVKHYYKNIKRKIPWIDKYRPQNLNEIVHQDEVIKMLKNTLENGNLPHTLFHGPPGTGKTSCILASAKQLYGPKIFNDRVIELNASDERGINVVRKKIITFAKGLVGGVDPNYPCPPYKIIILDEADAMTTEAQSALRKIMEDYSSITRFCFICNYINQIIEPINSRCVKFRFKSLNNAAIHKKLKFISTKEDMHLDTSSLNIITENSEGDMRKAIMLLQNLKYLQTYKHITEEDICEMIGCIPDHIIVNIEDMCILNKKSTIKDIVFLAKKIRSYGYPINNLLNKINKMIVTNKNLDDIMKSSLCLHLATSEKRLIDGADEYLQLLSILLHIKSKIMGIKTIHNENSLQ